MVAPIEDDTEGEVNIEDVEEEPAKFKKCPGDPTEAELEQHRTSHLPFRAWCKWCVMGRGNGTPHSNTGQTSRIPRIGLDYFYIIEGKVQMKHESELSEGELESKRSDGSVLKCILLRDWDNKAIWAHMVPQKGADEEAYTARLIASSDVQWLGYSRITFKI